MKKLNKDNNRKISLLRSTYLATTTTTATLFTLAIIFASTTVSPVSASTTGNTTTPSLGLVFSAQPIWDETVRTTAIIPINQTHSMATFEGNGTMTIPDTGETINMTNNGTAIGSIVPQANNTVISYGRENIFSVDDGDTSAITFFEIIQYDPTTFQGKGIVGAVFDNNATGSLVPFNGMMVVGTHEESPATQEVITRLWEWESGIPIPSMTSAITPTLEDSSTPPPPPIETPAIEDLTADDSTATTTTTTTTTVPIPEEEGAGH